MQLVISRLDTVATIIFEWFKDNYLKPDIDKCHLIISIKDTDVCMNINGQLIKNSKSQQLLGITIDADLNFNKHVENLCKRANEMLYALSRVAKYMNRAKLRLIMKAFIIS